MAQPNQAKKVEIIFCTKNSEKTIENAITNVKKSVYKPGIIVVDGFSSDDTKERALKAGADVAIDQPERKFPGKGIAMKAGLNEAVKRHANIALFLDADIKNLTHEWVDALAEPVIDRGYDMTRGFYEREPRDAAVTKLIARPALSVFFPELSSLEQPLSGEVCANMKVWTEMLGRGPPDGWGIDIWFLIEAAMSGSRIKEIFLGKKEHTSFDAYKEDIGKLSRMSEQVLFTILREAVNYRRFEGYKTVST
jgi:glycosyltransferase involved in cell wall biosynthesis